MPEVVKKRCAIYCRKSTDENLDTDFNSLDAQREAAENYIASQRANGWVCLPEHYDDGGYSGGNVNRPALQKLLSDCESGLIDIIITYRLDSSTHSTRLYATRRIIPPGASCSIRFSPKDTRISP